MKNLFAFILLSAFFSEVLLPSSSSAQDQINNLYGVVRVVDGDTLVATDGNIKFKIRLAGCDAPESHQDYGKVATARLRALVENQKIRVQPVANGLDMYSRVLANIYVGESDVALKLISEGMATYYRPKCVDYPENKNLYDYDPRPYVEAETKARAEKTGMWARPRMLLPCQFRKSQISGFLDNF